jgi:hypothetical protein
VDDPVVLLVDGHVHVHPGASPDRLLSAALANFQSEAGRIHARRWAGVLLLTEMRGAVWFETHCASQAPISIGRWDIVPSEGEDIGAVASCPAGSLLIVAGRQIATREKLEILTIGTRKIVADGNPLETTLGDALGTGALVVLPWAVGKWLGTRGKLIENAFRGDYKERLFAGDNGGRPAFWPAPGVFRHGLRPVLPGSDPLPLAGQEQRVGASGFRMAGELPSVRPAQSFLEKLDRATKADVQPFGKLENPVRFMQNQLALRRRRGT